MVNHLYWSALSTSDGDSQMLLEKWKSLANHIHNKHTGHGKKYKRCAHGRITKRKWLKYSKYTYWLVTCLIVSHLTFLISITDTKESEKLIAIINNKRLCNDIAKLSTSAQTSSLEAFHSLINQYAPKQQAFSYLGMLARSDHYYYHHLHVIKMFSFPFRLRLAALHYNFNNQKAQAVTKKGRKTLRCSIS